MDIGEAMALTNSTNNWMNNPFMYLIWLAFFGGDGFGWGRRGQGLTQAELQEGFNNQNVMRGINGITNGLSDGFYAMNTNALQGQNQLQRDLCAGFSAVNAAITGVGNQLGNQVAENRFAALQCCCETNRNIDGVKYENAQNTCAITTNATANTQRILDKLCMMEANAKDERIAELQMNLQAERYQNSQLQQNGTIIEAVRQLLGQRGCVGCQYLTAA